MVRGVVRHEREDVRKWFQIFDASDLLIKIGQILFQRLMGVAVAADKVSCTTANPETLRTLLEGVDQLGYLLNLQGKTEEYEKVNGK